MAMLQAKCFTMNSSPNHVKPSKQTTTTIRPISLLSHPNLPKGLTISKPSEISAPPSSTAAVIAGAIFSGLSSSDAAFAAQQVADIAEGDNRGLALLIPIVPAILWVLYNILQPALNQLNRMRSDKGLVAGLGLGGSLAVAGLALPSSASAAGEVAASSGDSRGLVLLFVVSPAVLWVLYNILQPALNQINRMRSG